MIEARAYLASHPECELCGSEDLTTPAETVGILEVGPDTFALAAVCGVHRALVVSAWRAEDARDASA